MPKVTGLSRRVRPNLRLAHSAKLQQSDKSPEELNARSFVLIVDDQSTSRKILEKLAYSIDSNMLIEGYDDPCEALDRVLEKTPDLIITDYQMPAMNGIEFTRRIRALPSCQDVPLVVVTIMQDSRIRYDALHAGATDFLTRPIDYQECLARCNNLLTMRRQQLIIRNRASWLEMQVTEATEQLHRREEETLLRLAKAGEYRDQETGNHVLRMAKCSYIIAQALGLGDFECTAIRHAAPMHDIGKIGISDEILLKPGKYTVEEFLMMQAHTTIGHDILKDSPSHFIELGSVIALNHHEKYDGKGYPYGLSGEEIPVEARIVAVADVYDALTSKRPYKDAWSSSTAIEHIVAESGKHFDPSCVQAFLSRIEAIEKIHEQFKDQETQNKFINPGNHH